MIDYKDLMIGNFVKIYNGDIYQVESTNYDCVGLVNSYNFIEQIMCDRIYPIEVTEDLLVKIGFEKYSHDIPLTEFRKKIGDYYVFVKHTKDRWYFRVYGKVYHN